MTSLRTPLWRALSAGESGLEARFGGVSLTVPAEKRSALASYIGKQVILGVRPEHIRELQKGEDEGGKCVVTVKAELAELLGSEMNIYFELDGKRHIARIASELASVGGGETKLVIESGLTHFFDKETTLAIGAKK